MTKRHLSRDALARSYANRHLKTDPGIREVYYLPADAPEREIRFVEVNELIANRDQDPLEPIDFGIETNGETAHRLVVLDVTPAQWEKINRRELPLPQGWTLKDATHILRK